MAVVPELMKTMLVFDDGAAPVLPAPLADIAAPPVPPAGTVVV
jgi:hypothetical protein